MEVGTSVHAVQFMGVRSRAYSTHEFPYGKLRSAASPGTVGLGRFRRSKSGLLKWSASEPAILFSTFRNPFLPSLMLACVHCCCACSAGNNW